MDRATAIHNAMVVLEEAVLRCSTEPMQVGEVRAALADLGRHSHKVAAVTRAFWRALAFEPPEERPSSAHAALIDTKRIVLSDFGPGRTALR